MAQQRRRDLSQPTPKRKTKRPRQQRASDSTTPKATADAGRSAAQSARALRDRFGYTEGELRSLVFTNFAHVDGIVIHGQARILDANQAFATMFGYELSEVIEMHALDFTAPESRDVVLRNLTGYTKPYEGIGLRKDGTTFPVEVVAEAVPCQEGTVGVGAIRDISERRRTEEALRQSEERFRSLFEATFEGILVHQNGLILDANPAFEKMSGNPLSELVGKPIVDLMTTESRDLFVDKIRSGAGEPDGWQAVALRNDGTTLDLEIAGKPCTYKGRPARVTAVRDVTERKRAAEALQESEKRFRSLCESAPIGIFLTDSQGTCTYANQYLLTLSGLKLEQCLGRRWTEVMHPDDREAVLGDFCKAVQEGRGFSREFRIRTHQGEWHWAQVQISPMPSTNGNLAGYVGTVEDVTERKKAEWSLRESEERYRDLYENAPVAYFSVETDGRIQRCNRRAQLLLAYTEEELVGKLVFDLYADTPEGKQKAGKIFQLFRNGDDVVDEDLQMRRADGTPVSVSLSVTPIRDPRGNVVASRSMVVDITERRRAEEALRHSEEKWRSLAENAPNIILTIDRGGTIQFINRTVPGAPSTEETIGMSAYAFILPEYHDVMTKAIERVFQTGQGGSYEIIGDGPDGRPSWYDMQFGPIRRDAQVVAVALIATDITERKRAEEALRQSEASARWLSNATSDIIMSLKVDGTVLSMNDAVQPMLGYRAEDVVGKNLAQFVHPEDVAAVRAAAEERLQGSPDNSAVECRVRHRDGSWRIVESIGTISTDNKGEIIPVLSTRDITNRKRAEEALRESEERYRLIAENASDVIWTMDMNLNVTYVSPSVTQLRGYTVEETMALAIEEALTPASYELAMKTMAEELAIEKMEEKDLTRTHTLEVEEFCKDGSTIWVEVNLSFLRDPDGRAVGIMGVSRDITERRRAEEALRESEEKYRRLVNDSLDGILIAEGVEMKFVNPAMLKMFGCDSEEEMVGHPFTDFVSPEYRKPLVEMGYDREKGLDVPDRYEHKALRKDGTEFYVEVSVSRVIYQGRAARQVIIRDITERKQMEEALEKAREDLESKAERQMRRGNVYGLTFREITVLHQVAAGESDRQIGITLGISHLTAQKHVANILAKMGAASRTEAGVRALREGLLD